MNAAPAVIDAGRIVVPAGDVQFAIDRTAVRIQVALASTEPVLICVMQGGLVYFGELLRRLHFPLETDYLHVGRYGNATRGGELTWQAGPHIDLAGRTLLVVDDVLDRGTTLAAILERLRGSGAREVFSTVLVRKALTGIERPEPDFVALECRDEYLFGCGMDYRGFGRNLPEIHALPPGIGE
jgi:hypoxanthine phosphoribosyltransferase